MGTDKVTGLFFFFLSVYVCIKSFQMGLGTFSSPKAGLFPFISGFLLAFLSVIGCIDKMPLKEALGNTVKTIRQVNLQKVIPILMAVFAYAFLLDILGFLFCTFLLVFLIYVSLEPKKIGVGILVAVLSAAATYFIFGIVVKTYLPRGFLGI